MRVLIDILHGLRAALIVWLPIVLLVALLYFMWRAVAMMPKTKTQAVKPDAGIAVLRDALGLVMDARPDLAHIAA